jgi:hypothetical protein
MNGCVSRDPLALLLAENDCTVVEGCLASFSLPHGGRRDAGTHTFGADLLHSHQREATLTGNISKNKVRLDLVPLNDRIAYHDDCHTTSHQRTFQDATEAPAVVEIGRDIVGPPRSPYGPFSVRVWRSLARVLDNSG